MTINRSKIETESRILIWGGRPFSETGSSKLFYLSRGLRCLIEIWYVNRYPPSKTPAVASTQGP